MTSHIPELVPKIPVLMQLLHFSLYSHDSTIDSFPVHSESPSLTQQQAIHIEDTVRYISQYFLCHCFPVSFSLCNPFVSNCKYRCVRQLCVGVICLQLSLSFLLSCIAMFHCQDEKKNLPKALPAPVAVTRIFLIRIMLTSS